MAYGTKVWRSPRAWSRLSEGGEYDQATTGVCVLAAQAGAKVHVLDVGIDADLIPGVVNMKVARGSAISPLARR